MVSAMKHINCLVMFSLLMITACREKESFRETPVSRATFEQKDTFTVAFYNTENLFDLNFDGLEYPEYRPGTSNWDQEIQRKKVENIASVISAMGADVVALCEVENTNALRQLKGALERRGQKYPHLATGEGPEKSITCTALLSKYPLRDIKGIPVHLGGTSKTRNILETDIVIRKDRLKLFVNHWPSKKQPESFRIKAAQTLRSRLLELPGKTEYVVLGDFNCDYNEYLTFKTFGHDDTNGKTSINHVLMTVSGGKNPGFILESELAEMKPGTHYDLWLELPESQRMSYVFKGNLQTPDHILLPAALYDSTGISYLDNSFGAFTWEGRLLKGGKPFRWQNRWKKKLKLHTGEGYSDHLPLFARFVKGPFSFDSSRSEVIPQNISQSAECDEGGFEQSTEGWICSNSGVYILRDTAGVAGGKYSLRISGDAREKNSSASKAVLVKSGDKDLLNLKVRGSGKISFRTRPAGGAWTYYNFPNGLKPSKSASYSEINLKNWKELSLETGSQNGEIELEVRVGKGAPFCLWVDDVRW